MKKQVFLIASLLVLIALGFSSVVSAAPVDNPTGWKIVFTLGDEWVDVGASDYGGYCGYTPGGPENFGIHLGIGPTGDVQSVIHTDAKMPVAESIVVWNNGDTDFNGILKWKWMNYDPVEKDYIPGPKPAYIDARLSLVVQIGDSTVTKINTNGGSVRIKLRKNGKATTSDARLVLSVQPAPSIIKIAKKNKL